MLHVPIRANATSAVEGLCRSRRIIHARTSSIPIPAPAGPSVAQSIDNPYLRVPRHGGDKQRCLQKKHEADDCGHAWIDLVLAAAGLTSPRLAACLGPDTGRNPANITPVLLFAATLFLGSFLMFLVEPMIAKSLLPVLGGAPMVWNICVLFFQIVLLVGTLSRTAPIHGPGRDGMPLSTERLSSFRFFSCRSLFLPTLLTARTSAPSSGCSRRSRPRSVFPFVLSTSASMLQKLFSENGPSGRLRSVFPVRRQ